MPFLVVGAVAGGYLAGAGLLGGAIGILGGAILGGTLGASIDARISQQRALKQQQASYQKQFQLQQTQANIQQVRATRTAIRQQRLAQAQMLNQAYQTGGAGSSGLSGGIASTVSQTGGRIGELNQTVAMNTKIGEAGLQAARYGTDAATYGAIGEITETIFGSVGGYQRIGKALG